MTRIPSVRGFLLSKGVAIAAALVAVIMAGCQGGGQTKAGVRPLASLVIPRAPAPVVPPGLKTPAPSAQEAEVTLSGVIPRSVWALSAPIAPRLDPMGKKTCITIHHEGMDTESYSSMSEVEDQLRKIQASHKERGFADIGYHFLIDYNGRIWEGRSLKYQGAHAGNGDANRGNIGICLMGNFEQQQPTSAQLASMRRLVVFLMNKYYIPVDRIYTHREVKSMYHLSETECPGRYLQKEVDRMRRSIAAAKRG